MNVKAINIDGTNDGVIRFSEADDSNVFVAESINGQKCTFEANDNAGKLTMIFSPSGNKYEMAPANENIVHVNGNEYTNVFDLYFELANYFKKVGGGTGTTPNLDQVLTEGNTATNTPEYFLTQDQDTFNQNPTAAVYTDNGTGNSTTITRDNQTRNGNENNAIVTMPRRSGIVQLENLRAVNTNVQLTAASYDLENPGGYLVISNSAPYSLVLTDTVSEFIDAPLFSQWIIFNVSGTPVSATTSGIVNVFPAGGVSFNEVLRITKVEEPGTFFVEID